MATLSLKLVVDKAKNRVVFAEADKDFVDILCSFLTLPLGTVIRVLDKKSTIGCMDKLYQSVENLDAEYLQTEACRKMLLEPRSESEIECENLKLNVDDLEPRRIYRCPIFQCSTKVHQLYSSILGTECPCGKAMEDEFQWTKKKVADGYNKDGVFVKSGKRFIIGDNLRVILLSSFETILSLFKDNGIEDMKTVEVKTVDVSRSEIIKLLGRLLVSSTPLTDVFLLELQLSEGNSEFADRQSTGIIPDKSEDNATATASKTIRVKLLCDQVSMKVLSAQVEDDFVDIIFSFLTFPLGLIVKLLDSHSSVGCLDNLYKSIEFSDDGRDYIKSEDRRNLLLAPKLFPHYGLSNSLLKLEEKLSRDCRALACENCWNEGIDAPDKMCKHNVAVAFLQEVNPKLPSSGTEYGGGYAVKSVMFMVSDEMKVMPLSAICGIEAFKESNATISSLVEREVTLGEVEVLRLLKACLNSHTALSSAFLQSTLSHVSSTKKRGQDEHS